MPTREPTETATETPLPTFTPTRTPFPTPTPEPREESRIIRFHWGPRITPDIAYWIEGEPDDRQWVTEGHRARNPIIFSIIRTRFGARIHAGANATAPIKYTIEGTTAYRGPNATGPATWSLCGAGGDTICTGRGETGPRLYHVDGTRVFSGASPTGQIIMTADTDFEDDPFIKLILPILIERLFEQW